MQARGIGAFLGVDEIGPPKQRETVILQRKGTRVEPPKHWSREQVQLQEQRDMVLMSRAAGTMSWKAYDRWWGLFSTFVTTRIDAAVAQGHRAGRVGDGGADEGNGDGDAG